MPICEKWGDSFINTGIFWIWTKLPWSTLNIPFPVTTGTIWWCGIEYTPTAGTIRWSGIVLISTACTFTIGNHFSSTTGRNIVIINRIKYPPATDPPPCIANIIASHFLIAQDNLFISPVEHIRFLYLLPPIRQLKADTSYFPVSLGRGYIFLIWLGNGVHIRVLLAVMLFLAKLHK